MFDILQLQLELYFMSRELNVLLSHVYLYSADQEY